MGPVRTRHSSHDLSGSPVILWISLGGKPKWLSWKFGYHDVMCTKPHLMTRCMFVSCHCKIINAIHSHSRPIELCFIAFVGTLQGRKGMRMTGASSYEFRSHFGGHGARKRKLGKNDIPAGVEIRVRKVFGKIKKVSRKNKTRNKP